MSRYYIQISHPEILYLNFVSILVRVLDILQILNLIKNHAQRSKCE